MAHRSIKSLKTWEIISWIIIVVCLILAFPDIKQYIQQKQVEKENVETKIYELEQKIQELEIAK